MKTKNFSKTNILLVMVMLFASIAACASSPAVLESTNIPEVNLPATPTQVEVEEGEGDAVEEVQLAVLPATSLESQLSETEAEGLIFMREEEKLARDVYLYLYELWGAQVFANIAQSEDSHMQAVLTLIERYGLEDPASSTGHGEFINTDLQKLYDELVAAGSLSLKDAYLVGATIEEVDILDIQTYIDATDHDDIIRVYESLIQGSSNHLRAFVQNIENQIGDSYLPQYLSQEAYDEIIGSLPGNGWRGNRGN